MLAGGSWEPLLATTRQKMGPGDAKFASAIRNLLWRRFGHSADFKQDAFFALTTTSRISLKCAPVSYNYRHIHATASSARQSSFVKLTSTSNFSPSSANSFSSHSMLTSFALVSVAVAVKLSPSVADRYVAKLSPREARYSDTCASVPAVRAFETSTRPKMGPKEGVSGRTTVT